VAPNFDRSNSRADYDTLLALSGAADTVVQEYLETYPQHTEGVIELFRAAQQRGFKVWDHLRQCIALGARRLIVLRDGGDRED